jgi:pseudoazurin
MPKRPLLGPSTTNRRAFLAGSSAIAASALLAPALARAQSGANFEVLMLNKGTDGKTMGFSPSFLRIEPGDTVTFIPVDKGHNAETILGMIPDAADTWKGKVDEEFTVTFTIPGLYGYKCFPHYAMGMVGLIQVGNDRSNMTQLLNVRLPARAQARMAELFAKTSPRR